MAYKDKTRRLAYQAAYRKENREKIAAWRAAKRRERYATDPKYREKIDARRVSGALSREEKQLAANRAYRAANRERLATRALEYYYANRDRILESIRERYRSDAKFREMRRQAERRYTALNRDAINAKKRGTRKGRHLRADVKAWQAAYRQRNRAKLLAQKVAHYESNRARCLATMSAYKKSPKGRSTLNENSRRHIAKITDKYIRELLSRWTKSAVGLPASLIKAKRAHLRVIRQLRILPT